MYLRRSAPCFCLCAVFVLCTAIPMSAASLSVTTPMTSTKVARGAKVTLRCHFDPQPEYIIWSFAATSPGGPSRTLVRCHLSPATCGALDGGSADFADAVVGANGTLWLPAVSERHNGTYKCDAYLKLDSASTEASLFVLVPPGQPEVAGSSLSATEGGQLVLSCVSRGASPPAGLRWSLIRQGGGGGGDGVAPSPDSVESVAAVGFDRSESRLTLNVTSADDGSAVVCLAEHPLANVSSSMVRIVVFYKPIIAPMNSVAVALGTEVQLVCSARGNPAPQIQLVKGSDQLTAVAMDTVSYKLIAQAKTVSGAYRCSAQNSIGQSELGFAVDVQYGPAVSCPGSVTGREGGRLQVDCLVDSNPRPTSVIWRRVAVGGRVASESSRLVINATARSDAGVWRCEATNRLLPNSSGSVAMEMTGSADTTLIVEYLPGLPLVAISNTRILRGDNISLVCQANVENPGIPSPTFEWSRPASTFSRSGPTLAFAGVSLSDAGMYFCTPVNSVGRGPINSVQLDVEQAPDWVESQPRPRLTVQMDSIASTTGTGGDVEIFSVACTAVAKPQAEIQWYKDGLAIDAGHYSLSTKATFVDSSYYRTESTLIMRGNQRTGGLRPEDNGRYLCEAKNSHGKIESEQELSVEFKPQILTKENKVSLPLGGGSVNLTCSVIGQPGPAVIWLRGDTPVGGIQVADPVLSYRSVSRLINARELGAYSCRAENRLGAAGHTFFVVNASVPDAPTGMRVVEVAWNRVLVAWKPGFSGITGAGGLSVQYWLQIRQFDSDQTIRLETSRRSDADTWANVTGLLPATNYTFAAFAINSLGRGAAAQPPLIVRTPMLALPSPSRVYIADGGVLRVAALGSYCMRVESSDDAGATWTPLQLCLPSERPELPGVSTRLLYRVSLCLPDRQEVCGPAVLSTDSMAALPDVSTATIAIVGTCCGCLILLLSVVLLYFCCRRRRPYKEVSEPGSQQRNEQHQQFAAISGDAGDTSGLTQHQMFHSAPDGKPYALVPPHPSLSADNVTTVSGSGRSSSLIKEETDGLTAAGAAGEQQSRSTVFATLRSGHNPLDASASNPTIFNYAQDYPDDNRNTDPYNFDPGYRQSGRKIVYEVVV